MPIGTRGRPRTSSSIPTTPELSTLKKHELQARLQDLGLSTQGNKPELLARLETARGLQRQSPPVVSMPARSSSATPRPGAPRTSSRGPAPIIPVERLSASELQDQLTSRRLSTSGTAQELQNRLRRHLEAEARRRAGVGVFEETGFEDAIGQAAQRLPRSTSSVPPLPARPVSAASIDTARTLFSPADSDSSFRSAPSPSAAAGAASAARSARSPSGASAAPASAARSESRSDDIPPDELLGAAARRLETAARALQTRDDKISEALDEMLSLQDKTLSEKQLVVYRSNAKKFPLTAAEVAAGRLPVRTLFVSQRAERMERLLENADSRERRVGRDFDAKFSTRQASTVLPQVMMRQTAPGPIAGLRVWEPARFADVNFVDTEVNTAA